jgi:RND family efflux transporter MFP subunit
MADEQIKRTRVTAPIAGLVSQVPVSAGDVVTPGSELFTIVDPGSMRLEAAVPADALGSLNVGAPVEFQVRGYPGRAFTGTVRRISPTADPATRQIPIYVSLPNTGGQLVGGLFAEGRVAVEAREALVVPSSAIEAGTTGATVLRVRGGRVEVAAVRTGIVDERRQRTEILDGLAAGDTVLTGAARGITPGSAVSVARLPAER